jgi:hypothetical protein
MENNQSVNTEFDVDNQTINERRGTFLLVLCVLSWIATGFGLFGVVSSFFGGEAGFEQQIAMLEESSTGVQFLDTAIESSIQTFEITLENFQLYHIGNTFILLTGIFSVFLMFNLKKIGYYLYIVYVIASILFYNMVFSELPTSLMTIIMMSFVSLVFVILYGVNLKRMNS